MSGSVFTRVRDRLLEQPLVYRLWQGPFADAKVKPLLRRIGPTRPRRVLDIGCGPGTNAALFKDSEYVGIDLNPEYIDVARRRARGRFIVGDVTDLSVLPHEEFDLVFANSLMHHLPDSTVLPLLHRMAELCAPGGEVHVLDLILPADPSAARMLARADRGAYARPVDAWKQLFGEALNTSHTEVYPLGLPGLPLWWMIYLSGTPR
jgi:SAM-dependent methyltransferase